MRAKLFALSLVALCSAASAQNRFTLDTSASRVNSDGPVLSLYAQSMVGVAECKIDASNAAPDAKTRLLWDRKCYDLYEDPVVREQMYRSDTRPERVRVIELPRPVVIIVVPKRRASSVQP